MTTEEENDSEQLNEEHPVDRVLSLVEEIYEAVIDDIVDRTTIVEVKRFGAHEITKFKDGRVVCLSRRRWAGDREAPPPPTPYELLQLGEDPRPLYPVQLSIWQMAGLGILPAVIGSWAPLLLGWGRRFRGRHR